MVTIESDLKEIFGKLDQRLDRIESSLGRLEVSQAAIIGDIKAIDERLSGQINALDKKFSGEIKALDEKLSGQIKSVDERLSGQINTLDEKVTGISKRLENQEFINRSIFATLAIAVIAGAAKFFGIFPNP